MDIAKLMEEHVRRRLEDSFGAAVTLMIIASATRVAGVPALLTNTGDYLRLIHAICGDERVLGMWGKAGADQALRQWSALL